MRPSPYSYGTDVSGLTNLQDVLEKANLNFAVKDEPLYYEDNGIFIPTKDSKATFASDDSGRDFLSTVGGSYKPIQNSELFQIANELIDSDAIQYNYAGCFKGRSRVFISAEIKGLTNLDNDPIKMNLIIRTAHDGSGSTKVNLSPVRLFCNNQLPRLRKESVFSFTLKHTKNYKTTMIDKLGLMTSAEQGMKDLIDYTKVLKRQYIKKITDTDIKMAVALTLNLTTDHKNGLDSLTTKSKNILTNAVGALYNGVGQVEKDMGSAYWFANGMTTFEQNHKKITNTDSYLDKYIFKDFGSNLAEKAIKTLENYEYV
jgi:phage/plasmid-like protein (TIGR03299 family)